MKENIRNIIYQVLTGAQLTTFSYRAEGDIHVKAIIIPDAVTVSIASRSVPELHLSNIANADSSDISPNRKAIPVNLKFQKNEVIQGVLKRTLAAEVNEGSIFFLFFIL